MRISKDYAFDLITRLGQEIQKSSLPDKELEHTMWRLQKSLAYGDLRPKEVVQELHRLFEHRKDLPEHWIRALRLMAI